MDSATTPPVWKTGILLLYDWGILAGAKRIERFSLVLETKAQPLYQTPKNKKCAVF